MGESYNGNSVRLQINFLAPLLGNGCHIFFEPSLSSYLYLFFLLYKKHKIIFTMKTTPIQYRFASKGEFIEPPPKPNHSSGSGLHPSFIAMVRAQPFSGLENETLAITC